MARTNSILHDNLKGAIGKQIVFRVRGGKTFASKYPDMSRVKPSPKQRAEKSKFAEAVKYAQSIINDPAKKAAYKVKKGKTVYHTAIKDYLKKQK
jgi:hypothetical protein